MIFNVVQICNVERLLSGFKMYLSQNLQKLIKRTLHEF